MSNEVIDAEFTDLAPVKSNNSLENLSDTDRAIQVWSLRVKGVPIPAIAKTYGIAIEQVHKDLDVAGLVYRKEILSTDGVGIIASNLQWLDEMERTALYEANQAQSKVEKEVDPVTGKVVETVIVDKNRAAFLDTALNTRKLKIQLLKDCGIISKDNPELLFRKLDDYANREEETIEERTEEEIQASITKLMKYGRFMKKPLGG